MKKLFVLFVTSVLLLGISLSLTGCIDIATDFPTSTIENGYYNYIAGGNMACVDDSLYLNRLGGSIYLGTNKYTQEEAVRLFPEKIEFDLFVDYPSMYQLEDKLYFIYPESTEFRLFDCSSDSFTEETIDFESNYGIYYVSEDLKISMTYDGTDNLKFKYKDNEEVTLDKPASTFTVYDNKIYFITQKGALYYDDPSQLKSECEFVSRLNDNGLLPKMLICNGYCYFTDSGTSDTKEGVYRYSFEKDTVELVLDQEVISMNMQGDKVYFATEKGVYVDDSVECTKFTSKKATELYVFDDEWIYLYNQDKGLIHRVSNDGTQTQLID